MTVSSPTHRERAEQAYAKARLYRMNITAAHKRLVLAAAKELRAENPKRRRKARP